MLYLSNGDFYNGEWEDDKMKGWGVYYFAGGEYYEGGFFNDGFHGLGIYYYANGDRYEGEFRNNKKNGMGQLCYVNGDNYRGEWQNDKMGGWGEYLFTDGGSYTGEFQNGKYHGHGCFCPVDGYEYEGEFREGKKHGNGKEYDKNGEIVYEGFFQNNYRAFEEIFVEKQPIATSEQVSMFDDFLVDYLSELNSMIGLERVKREVRDLAALIQVQNERKRRGLATESGSTTYHMVFTGNPGTGKTTVARLLGQIFASLGVVSDGKMVEMDRAGLVASYVGQTEEKTNRVIQSAMGGILYIDEAYALAKKDSPNDYGKDAIDCLLKRMEDNRDRFVVIVAGYEKPMEEFLSANPGLKSRFNTYIHFENYSVPELVRILERFCEKEGYVLQRGFCERLTENLERRMQDAMLMDYFSNGRYIRN